MEQVELVYYPQIMVTGGYMSTLLSTYVRIKRDNVWYVVLVTRKYEWDVEYFVDEAAVHEVNLKKFHEDVYMYQQCLKVDPDAVGNQPGIFRCPYQVEESDRLLKLYPEGI